MEGTNRFNLNYTIWVRLSERGMTSYLAYLNEGMPPHLHFTRGKIWSESVDGLTPIQGWKLIEWAGGTNEHLAHLFSMNVRVTQIPELE